jgi:hypothetical protein
MKTNFSFFFLLIFTVSSWAQQTTLDPSYVSPFTATNGVNEDIAIYSFNNGGIFQNKLLYGLNGSSSVLTGLRRSNLDGFMDPSDVQFGINASIAVQATSVDDVEVEYNLDGSTTGNVFCSAIHRNPRLVKLDINGNLVGGFNFNSSGSNVSALLSKIDGNESLLFAAFRMNSGTVQRISPTTGDDLFSLNLTPNGTTTAWVSQIVNIGPNQNLIVGRFLVTSGGITYRNAVMVDNNLQIIQVSSLAFNSINGMIFGATELNGNLYFVGSFNEINGNSLPGKIAKFDYLGSGQYGFNSSFVPDFIINGSNLNPYSEIRCITSFGCGIAVGCNEGSRGVVGFNEAGARILHAPTNAAVSALHAKYLNDGDSEIELIAGGSFASILLTSSPRIAQINGFSIDPSYKNCAYPTSSSSLQYNIASVGVLANQSSEWILEESLDNGGTWNSVGIVFEGESGGVLESQSGVLYRLTHTVISCSSSCQFSSVFGDVQFGCGPYQAVESQTKSFSSESENGTEVSTLTVFPNPFSDRMSITANEFNNDDLVDVIIFDVNGAQVYTAEKQFAGDLQNGIDVSNLAAGAYLVVLKSKTAVYSYKALKK